MSETEKLIAEAREDADAFVNALADALEAAEAEKVTYKNEGLRDVFEAARRLVGLREGCTYDAVVSRLKALSK